MPGVIVVTGLEAASNADMLQGTRLQSMPGPGVLTIEAQSTANDATNDMSVGLQLPGGDNPLSGARVPAGVTAGGLNQLDKMIASFAVTQGGHAVFSVIESGTAVLFWRATYKPR